MHLVERADAAMLQFLNSLAGKSSFFDHAVNLISRLDLFKGVFVFGILWGAWFARSRDDARTARRDVVLTLLAAGVAAPLSRVLQLVLPFRARPILRSPLNFSAPIVYEPGELHRWSSFPSDHAAIFFAIAMGMWFSFRKLAWLLLAWSILVVSLPRLYLGLHYPSDVLGGAALGIGVVLLVRRFAPLSAVDYLLLAEQRRPALFYGGAFMLSYLIATLFNDIREIGAGLAKYYSG
jgi:undecaprenyl-diphosphatase